jgi:hypothetical protein
MFYGLWVVVESIHPLVPEIVYAPAGPREWGRRVSQARVGLFVCPLRHRRGRGTLSTRDSSIETL